MSGIVKLQYAYPIRIEAVLLFGVVTLNGLVACAASLRTNSESSGELRKEIADPCLGYRWQLYVDPAHPGWPGRFVLLDPNGYRHGNPVQTGYRKSQPGESAILIRAGDRVILNQDSGVLQARFEAVALESASADQTLRVRLLLRPDSGSGRNAALTASGPVLTAVAIAAGQARWLAVMQAGSASAGGGIR